MKKSSQNEQAPSRGELSKISSNKQQVSQTSSNKQQPSRFSANKQQASQISANKHLRPTALEPLMKPSKSADSLDSGIYSRSVFYLEIIIFIYMFVQF